MFVDGFSNFFFPCFARPLSPSSHSSTTLDTYYNLQVTKEDRLKQTPADMTGNELDFNEKRRKKNMKKYEDGDDDELFEDNAAFENDLPWTRLQMQTITPRAAGPSILGYVWLTATIT